MSEKRKWNFFPGPAVLPLPAIKKAQASLVDFNGTGLGFLETSHRSPQFKAVMEETKARMKRLLSVPDSHEVLFCQGGATLQFSLVPMNIMGEKKAADYVDTGTWSTRAINAAKLEGKVNVVASSEDKSFTYLPKLDEVKWSDDAAYVHMTSNNTIYGTQYRTFPDTGDKPLVCDMSSDIMSHQLDVSKFGIIYAGAQKNMGPAGVTVVIIDKALAQQSPDTLPPILQYSMYLKKDSAYNTPPTFAIYMVGLVLEWAEERGGLEAIEKENNQKAELLYSTMDADADFFRGTVAKEDRSYMNVTMRLPSEELEKKFLAEAEKRDLAGLKGHRSVGGIRVSMYNAMPLQGIEALVAFMKEFRKTA